MTFIVKNIQLSYITYCVIIGMTRIQTQIKIDAPVNTIFEYYTNPDTIKESWSSDIVKESENESTKKKTKRVQK